MNATSVSVAKLNSKGGATVKVTPASTGRVTVRLTVAPKAVGRSGKKPIVIATGSRTLQAGTAGKIKVKFTKKGKSIRKKLKGVRVNLVLTQNGATTTRVLRLK